MNFQEAIKELKKGNKIRRKSWVNEEFYLVKRYDGKILMGWAKDIPVKETDFWIVNMGIVKDINATDWEIYKEKKTLFDKLEEYYTKEALDDVKQALKEFINWVLKQNGRAGLMDINDKAKEIFGEELIE